MSCFARQNKSRNIVDERVVRKYAKVSLTAKSKKREKKRKTFDRFKISKKYCKTFKMYEVKST